MSVEHTTQLIQLILNSVLMVLSCALVLGRLGARSDEVEARLQLLKRQCLELLSLSSWRSESLVQLKKQLRQLQYRYRWLSYGVFWANYALLLAIASTMLLSLRTLIEFEWLVVVSLVAFAAGIGLLFLAIGCGLVDLHSSQRSLMVELLDLLGTTRVSEVSRWRRSASMITNSSSNLTTVKPALKARVG